MRIALRDGVMCFIFRTPFMLKPDKENFLKLWSDLRRQDLINTFAVVIQESINVSIFKDLIIAKRKDISAGDLGILILLQLNIWILYIHRTGMQI